MEVFRFTSGLAFWKENVVFLLFLWKAAAQTAPSALILYLTPVLWEDLNKKCQGGKNRRHVISHAIREVFLIHL